MEIAIRPSLEMSYNPGTNYASLEETSYSATKSHPPKANRIRRHRRLDSQDWAKAIVAESLYMPLHPFLGRDER